MSSPWPRERIGVAAARARAAGLPVDGALAAGRRRARRASAARPRRARARAPRRSRRRAAATARARACQSASAFQTFPIPATRRWSSSASPSSRPLVLAPQVRDHRGEVGRLGEDVRPEPARAARGQLEHRPVPEHRLALGAGQHEPRLAAPRAPRSTHLPAAAHAQVAAQHEAALEAQEQVLADRLDRLEPATVEPLGDEHRGRARVRRLDRDALARRAPAACAPRGGASLPRASPRTLAGSGCPHGRRRALRRERPSLERADCPRQAGQGFELSTLRKLFVRSRTAGFGFG